MNKLIMLLCIIMADRAISEERWFCTDDQAIRQGNVLSICGVGNSMDEGPARKEALNNAMDEFKSICSLSSDCRGHKINVEPKRSTCFEKKRVYAEYTNTQFVCHRMFVFTILEGK